MRRFAAAINNPAWMFVTVNYRDRCVHTLDLGLWVDCSTPLLLPLAIRVEALGTYKQGFHKNKWKFWWDKENFIKTFEFISSPPVELVSTNIITTAQSYKTLQWVNYNFKCYFSGCAPVCKTYQRVFFIYHFYYWSVNWFKKE